ncbi:AAA family ATPase [Thermoactinospora rubra]|uniref:AAA family ATPase n=1 Tax=Thermoactinospora rubra TaxID=1088767 RepID=UPI000A0FB8E7|nr:hypothetical protein [Thermoactinospora rubra]
MPYLPKPSDLFDRAAEWGELTTFMAPGGPDSLRLGVVYGRRRQGKSEILQQLCDATGGLYTLALEQHARPMALQRFADELAAWAGLPTGLGFTSWEGALETAVTIAGDKARRSGSPQLIVIDELPFLMTHSPELPGVLQWLYDAYGPMRGGGRPPVRLILCGSALSVMSDLLSESKALYGRAMLSICLDAFDHVTTAEFWKIDDPETAFRLHSIIGGVPGYRALTAALPSPRSVHELDEWLIHTVFNPAHAMFDEVDLLFSQEPGVRDRAMYYAILTAIANGESTPARIASRLERDARTMSYPLNVLKRSGFIFYDEDLLHHRKPVIAIADPIMRFHHTITLPRLQFFQRRGQAARAWAQAQRTFTAQILGPHFEHLAREWTITSLADRTGLEIGWTGTTSVACREHSVSHEIDVVSLALGDMPRTGSARIVLLGEAKCTNRPRDPRDVARLEHIRDLLGPRAQNAHLALFSRTGFHPDLMAMRNRGDLVLVSLEEMFPRS